MKTKFNKLLPISLITAAVLAIPKIAFGQAPTSTLNPARSVIDILRDGLLPQQAEGYQYEMSDIFAVLAGVLTLLFTFSAVIAVIYIIIGGYYYVTAYGNPEAIQKGKQTITWAVVGLIVCIAAYAIVQFTWNTIGSGEPPSPTNSAPATTTTPPATTATPPGI